MKSEWVSFKDRWPPKSARLDNPAIETTDKVLVTNGLDSRDAMGRMSNVWLGYPVKDPHSNEVVMFDDGNRKICALTHWKDAGLK